MACCVNSHRDKTLCNNPSSIPWAAADGIDGGGRGGGGVKVNKTNLKISMLYASRINFRRLPILISTNQCVFGPEKMPKSSVQKKQGVHLNWCSTTRDLYCARASAIRLGPPPPPPPAPNSKMSLPLSLFSYTSNQLLLLLLPPGLPVCEMIGTCTSLQLHLN